MKATVARNTRLAIGVALVVTCFAGSVVVGGVLSDLVTERSTIREEEARHRELERDSRVAYDGVAADGTEIGSLSSASKPASSDRAAPTAADGRATKDGWWYGLRRHREKWLVDRACSSVVVLVRPELYVRSVDLNPKDTPLSRERFEELSGIVASCKAELDSLQDRRFRDAAAGLTRMVDEGILRPASYTEFDPALRAAYDRETRVGLARARATSGSAHDADSTRIHRLAMINTLGHTYGFVQEREGRFFAAKLGEIAGAAVSDQAVRQTLGDYWLVIIGFMVTNGALDSGAASELAHSLYLRLGLH